MAAKRSPWIHELSWPAIAENLKANDIVLVPIGATEQHGPHTPLMVDTAWAIHVSEAVAERTGALVAPPLHYGWSPHHLAYPGGITLRPETLIQVAVDVGESLLFHGFRKIVLVNGNRIANLPPMEIAATKLRFKTGCFSAVVDIGLIARKEVAEICGHVPNSTDHAADAETSYMLFVHPELVDMAKAPHVPPKPAGKAGYVGHVPLERPYDANMVLVHPTLEEYAAKTAPTGIGGDPRAATREKGQRIFESVVGNFAAYIEDVKKLEVRLKPIEVPI